MRNTLLIFALVLVFSPASLLADIQVTSRTDNGTESVVKLNQQLAAITDSSEPDSYMLIDMKSNELFMIDVQQKMIVKLDSQDIMLMTNPAVTQKPDISIKIIKSGKGPRIAGFKTTRYRLTANGETCSEHFISMEPLKHKEIRRFSKVMEKQAALGMGEQFAETACEHAENQFEKDGLKYGIPLLSKDAKGRELFRILRIETDKHFSAAELGKPGGYKLVSQQELIQQQMNNAMFSQNDGSPASFGKMPSEQEIQEMTEQFQQQLKMLEEINQPRAEN